MSEEIGYDFSKAEIGHTLGLEPNCESRILLDYDKCIDILIAEGLDEEDAQDYLCYNASYADATLFMERSKPEGRTLIQEEIYVDDKYIDELLDHQQKLRDISKRMDERRKLRETEEDCQ